MAEKYDASEGVWRTIGGRKVFIRTGQSLSEAMKESGKFSRVKKNEGLYKKLEEEKSKEDVEKTNQKQEKEKEKPKSKYEKILEKNSYKDGDDTAVLEDKQFALAEAMDEMSDEGLDDEPVFEKLQEQYEELQEKIDSGDYDDVDTGLSEKEQAEKDVERANEYLEKGRFTTPGGEEAIEGVKKQAEEKLEQINNERDYRFDFGFKDGAALRSDAFEDAKAYLEQDDMAQYLDDDLKDKISSIKYSLDDEASVHVDVKANQPLNAEDMKNLKSFIEGQNSDGLGESFEQQDFAEGYYDPDTGEGPYTYREVQDIVQENYDNMDVSEYIEYVNQDALYEGTEAYLDDGYFSTDFNDYLVQEGIIDEDDDRYVDDRYALKEEFPDEYDEWVEMEQEDFVDSGYFEEYVNANAIDQAKYEVARNDPKYNENLWGNGMTSMEWKIQDAKDVTPETKLTAQQASENQLKRLDQYEDVYDAYDKAMTKANENSKDYVKESKEFVKNNASKLEGDNYTKSLNKYMTEHGELGGKQGNLLVYNSDENEFYKAKLEHDKQYIAQQGNTKSTNDKYKELSVHDDYIRTTAPYDDTDYAYASKQGDKWVVRNPIKGETREYTFDTKEEAMDEMIDINKHIRSGNRTSSYEGITKYDSTNDVRRSDNGYARDKNIRKNEMANDLQWMEEHNPKYKNSEDYKSLKQDYEEQFGEYKSKGMNDKIREKASKGSSSKYKPIYEDSRHGKEIAGYENDIAKIEPNYKSEGNSVLAVQKGYRVPALKDIGEFEFKTLKEAKAAIEEHRNEIINNNFREKAFQKYKKEHPSSKKTLKDFKKQSKNKSFYPFS